MSKNDLDRKLRSGSEGIKFWLVYHLVRTKGLDSKGLPPSFVLSCDAVTMIKYSGHAVEWSTPFAIQTCKL